MPEDDLTQPSPTPTSQPRVLADRYDVIEVVGSGASAVTWRGHDRRLDRQVAIKILRREGQQDAAYVERFEREARTSASVSSGNVVNVFDVGQQDGWLYLVMQLVDGEDLKHMIVRRGPIPAGEARAIARQILTGLAAIHHAGILHRDIKPQNVLVDRNGVVRVADFGIAQTAIDIGLTTAGTTVGTAAYMAPEQAQAGPLSEATDIYAVGVVLYEMLTGALPYVRPTAMATMLAHIQEEPPPPSQRAPGQRIPPQLDGIVLQAMAKNPGDRFRSAAAMQKALERDSIDGGATTRIAPAPVPGQRTQAGPSAARRQVWPGPARPPAAPPPGRERGSSGRGLLNAVLVLILLAMTVVAAYTYYAFTNNRETDSDDPDPTIPLLQVAPTDEPQPTDPQVELFPTDAPEPTEESVVEPPDEEPEPTPTDTPEPTFEPAPEPEPTDEPTEPELTGEPTEVPIVPAGGEDPVIEPEGNPDGD